MSTLDEDTIKAALRNQIRRKVQKRMAARLGLLWHVAVFALVNLALYAINHAYSPNVLWFVWPLAAWGSAVLLHAFAVFSRPRSEQMIEAEVEREFARRELRS